ncbi:MAG: restriction endonuclease subunit S [archaeon]
MKAKTVIENGFKETEIGLVPSDWDVVELTENSVARLIMGQSPPSSTYNEDKKGLPFLQGKAEFGSVNPSPEKWCTKPSRIVEKNDVLISVRAPVGDVNISPFQCSIGRGLAAIRADKKSLPHFLFYYLQYSKKRIEDEGTGSTFKAINKSVLEHFKMILPEITEQQKIVSVLSKIQQAIEQQDKIIQITKELKKSLMSRLFSEGLHSEEQKETEIGLVPKSWEVVTVGDTCEKPQYGYTESSTHKPIGPKFLRITDITEKGVNWAEVPYCKCPKDLIEKYKLQREDIVFARIGATTGKSYIIEDCPLAVYASYLIRVRTKEKVYSAYLYYFFNSDMYWQQINANKGSSLKMGVNGSILAALKFPLPKIEEQKEIVNILSNIDKKLTQSESRKQTLQTLFKTMLNQLMTGKVRVKNLDIEVN